MTVDVEAVHIWAQLMCECADETGRIRQHEATCPVGWVWPLIREVDQLRADVAYLHRHEGELALKLTAARQRENQLRQELEAHKEQHWPNPPPWQTLSGPDDPGWWP